MKWIDYQKQFKGQKQNPNTETKNLDTIEKGDNEGIQAAKQCDIKFRRRYTHEFNFECGFILQCEKNPIHSYSTRRDRMKTADSKRMKCRCNVTVIQQRSPFDFKKSLHNKGDKLCHNHQWHLQPWPFGTSQFLANTLNVQAPRENLNWSISPYGATIKEQHLGFTISVKIAAMDCEVIPGETEIIQNLKRYLMKASNVTSNYVCRHQSSETCKTAWNVQKT